MSLPSELPIVNTRKEFMDQLSIMMSTPLGPEEDEEEVTERRGRPRELKSYLIENNSRLPVDFQTNGLVGTIKGTGVETIKILELKEGQTTVDFYLDWSDSRFWLLHTNALAEDAGRLVRNFVTSTRYQLDRTWFPSEMLNHIPSLSGNSFKGFGLEYSDFFTEDEQLNAPIEDLTMSVSGSRASKALYALLRERELENSLSYNRVRVMRGMANDFVIDDLNLNGTFSVKSGTSIDDHASLIDVARTIYKKMVEAIEHLQIGVSTKENMNRIEGKAFDFTFNRQIENMDKFLALLLSAKAPFRLWGLKTKLYNTFYQVLAIDLHTGHRLDLEVTQNLIRVYLPKGSCGNAVLRLYSNLQHYFDSKMKCEEIHEIANA